MSKEIYRWLRLKTEGEAKLVVTAEEEGTYGFKVWGLLQAKYNRRTMARLMRLMQESMYPKQVQMEALRNEDPRPVEDGGDAEDVPEGDQRHGGK